MEKVSRLIMNGVFAVDKPSGISSASCLNKIQHIFNKSEIFAADLAAMQATKLDNYKKSGSRGSRRKLKNIKVKMGHGGTLDPLASGVLVVGIGDGTKKLQNYLNGSVKVYETEALLGASTTTGDSEGEILTRTKVDHITKSLVEETREKFVGDLTQTPPLFSALKMDGMPLYEYARKGLPLPKKIKPREVQVHYIDICDDSLNTLHDYVFKKPELDEDGVPLDKKLSSNPTLNDDELFFSKQYVAKVEKEGLSKEVEAPKLLEESEFAQYESDSFRAPLLHFVSKVSSGTYIRSLISDFGKALSSSAYMVKLIRKEQAEWKLNYNVFDIEDFETDEKIWGPVLKKVLDGGSEINVKEALEEAKKSVTPGNDKKRGFEDVEADEGETTGPVEAKQKVSEEV